MEQDAKRFFMASDPPRFEAFEVEGTSDPKIMACVREAKGERYGDLLFVAERTLIGLTEEQRVRLKLPEDLQIMEYKYIFLLRWDSMGWKPLVPFFKPA